MPFTPSSLRRILAAVTLGISAFLAGCVSQSNHLPVRTADLPRPIRVACVGDSITYGHLIPERDRQSYPAVLGRWLGSDWQVGNFGRNGATLLRQSPRPYHEQPEYRDALAFRPHIVVLQLGTNDTKRETWEAAGDRFLEDALTLIHSFQDLETKPRLVLCLPIPLFRDQGKPWDTDQVLREKIIPRLREAAQRAKVPTLDMYALFADQSALMPDGVHPNARGAERMARAVYTALTGSPAPESSH